MPYMKCRIHGGQFAGCFCAHAARAVERGQYAELSLVKNRWGWVTLCPSCVQLPAREREANTLVCAACIKRWCGLTGSDYLERCRRLE